MMPGGENAKGPAIAATDVPARKGSGYPGAHAAVCAERVKRRLGDAFGLNNFGVNLVHLPPGAASAHRHWHSRQDELVYVLEGELTLVTDSGEQALGPGMTAGFAAGTPDGHQLINRSQALAVYLEIGDRSPGDEVEYPDIDMALRLVDGGLRFVRKDGTPYEN